MFDSMHQQGMRPWLFYGHLSNHCVPFVCAGEPCGLAEGAEQEGMCSGGTVQVPGVDQ